MIMTRQFYGLPALSSFSSNPIRLSGRDTFTDSFVDRDIRGNEATGCL
jgi:hypothetical protein